MLDSRNYYNFLNDMSPELFTGECKDFSLSTLECSYCMLSRAVGLARYEKTKYFLLFSILCTRSGL